MNRPLRPAESVPWEEPHITAAGRRLHRPAVFITHVLPLTNRFGASRTLPAAKPRKRAKRP